MRLNDKWPEIVGTQPAKLYGWPAQGAAPLRGKSKTLILPQLLLRRCRWKLSVFAEWTEGVLGQR